MSAERSGIVQRFAGRGARATLAAGAALSLIANLMPDATSARSPEQTSGLGAPVFIPWTGENLGGELPPRITVQNVDAEDRAYLVVHFPSEGEPGCPACRVSVVECSPAVVPGGTWSASDWTDDADGGAAAVFGMAPEAQAVWCNSFDLAGGDPTVRCIRYRELLNLAWGGSMRDTMGVTTRVPRRAGLGAPAMDLMGGVSSSDTGMPGTGPYAYAAPGAHIATFEGFNSTLAVQNAGSECATARLSLFLTGEGAQGQAVELTIPPGEARRFLPSEWWPFRDTGAVLVESDQPLAVAVSTVGYDTSAAHGASPVSVGDTWWAPLAFQEERRAVDPEILPGDWRGGQSVVNALNLTTRTIEIQVRTQAYGHAARDVGIPVQGSEQTAFQLGFGLGLDGGPGWGRLSTDGGIVIAALESYRTENMGPRVVEQYSTRLARRSAEPYRTFALPDLAGPAIGSGGLLATDAMTNLLETRVAIQNMLGAPATVALEAVGECGPTGAVTHTIAADQALVLSARQLPGVAAGIDSSVIRVLDGEVAAMVDTVRVTRSGEGVAPPVDLTSGYLAPGFTVAYAGAEPPRAVLAASETDVTLRPGSYAASVDLTFTAEGPRCLGFTARSGADWLQVSPLAGALPGRISLYGVPELFPRDGTDALETDVVITATAPDVAGSPLTIRVVVEVPGEGTAYIPVARKP